MQNNKRYWLTGAIIILIVIIISIYNSYITSSSESFGYQMLFSILGLIIISMVTWIYRSIYIAVKYKRYYSLQMLGIVSFIIIISFLILYFKSHSNDIDYKQINNYPIQKN